MEHMAEIKLGKYRHFKGGEYEVLGVAKHSETLENLVVYKNIEKNELWVRPLKNFLEQVDVNGKKMSRFSLKGGSAVGGKYLKR